MSVDSIQKSSLATFCDSLAPSSEKSFFRTSFETICTPIENGYRQIGLAVNWMIENRGGLAKIAGLLIIPAQHIANDHISSNQIINRHLVNGLRNANIEKIKIPIGNDFIEGIICYPKDWTKEDNSRCIIYHNPNGIALAGFFVNDEISWTPGKFFELKNSPIILYDYRGVGLNQDATTHSSLRFRATYESIVADGQAALKYALAKFQKVEVIGSSLGGSVATASLSRHLTKTPSDTKRITQLINHDSLTTTPRVVFPNYPWIADCLGYTVGAKLDAITPMKNLIDRGIKVTILYHMQDPVIPFGARMGDLVQTFPKKANVTVFASPYYGHANLSPDMINFL